VEQAAGIEPAKRWVGSRTSDRPACKENTPGGTRTHMPVKAMVLLLKRGAAITTPNFCQKLAHVYWRVGRTFNKIDCMFAVFLVEVPFAGVSDFPVVSSE